MGRVDAAYLNLPKARYRKVAGRRAAFRQTAQSTWTMHHRVLVAQTGCTPSQCLPDYSRRISGARSVTAARGQVLAGQRHTLVEPRSGCDPRSSTRSTLVSLIISYSLKRAAGQTECR